MLAVTQEGVITGFLLAPASTDDRMCWRTGQHRTLLSTHELPRNRKGRKYVGPT